MQLLTHNLSPAQFTKSNMSIGPIEEIKQLNHVVQEIKSLHNDIKDLQLTKGIKLPPGLYSQLLDILSAASATPAQSDYQSYSPGVVRTCMQFMN